MLIEQLWARFQPYSLIEYRDAESGELTGEADNIHQAFKPVLRLFGKTPVVEFGPRRLKQVRELMETGGSTDDAGIWQPIPGFRSLSRSTVNARINKVRLVLGWGVQEEIVTIQRLHELREVRALKAGKCRAREAPKIFAVAWRDVERTMEFMSPMVRDMILIQWWTGMRPGEVCVLRPGDVNRANGRLWIYRPHKHKNKWRNHDRLVPIGPRAQKVLEPYLRTRMPLAYCFTHRRRGGNRGRGPTAGRYTTNTFGQAVRRACAAAGVVPWTRLQVRHAAACRLERDAGMEAVRVCLSHKTQEMTEGYLKKADADPQIQLHREAMIRFG